MAREELNLTMEMTPDNKRRVMVFVGALTGLYSVAIRPRRPSRTHPQNAFFHGPVLDCFIAYQREQGISLTTQEAKDFFKMRFLRKSIPDKRTGELMETVRETHKLDIAEFSVFLEQVLAFMAEYGIVVPEQAIFTDPPQRSKP